MAHALFRRQGKGQTGEIGRKDVNKHDGKFKRNFNGNHNEDYSHGENDK